MVWDSVVLFGVPCWFSFAVRGTSSTVLGVLRVCLPPKNTSLTLTSPSDSSLVMTEAVGVRGPDRTKKNEAEREISGL